MLVPSSCTVIPIVLLMTGDDPEPLAKTISVPPEVVKAALVIGSAPLVSAKRVFGVKNALPVAVPVRMLLCIECTLAGAAIPLAWAVVAAGALTNDNKPIRSK